MHKVLNTQVLNVGREQLGQRRCPQACRPIWVTTILCGYNAPEPCLKFIYEHCLTKHSISAAKRQRNIYIHEPAALDIDTCSMICEAFGRGQLMIHPTKFLDQNTRIVLCSFHYTP